MTWLQVDEDTSLMSRNGEWYKGWSGHVTVTIEDGSWSNRKQKAVSGYRCKEDGEGKDWLVIVLGFCGTEYGSNKELEREREL